MIQSDPLINLLRYLRFLSSERQKAGVIAADLIEILVRDLRISKRNEKLDLSALETANHFIEHCIEYSEVPSDPASLRVPELISSRIRRRYAGYCRCCTTARSSSPCFKCGDKLSVLTDDHSEPLLPDIERISSLAKEVGYAIGIHGSMERDLDLMAMSWTEDAVTPLELAEHIAKGINGRVINHEIQDKPKGRWSCNIQIDGWFKIIDLSVR